MVGIVEFVGIFISKKEFLKENNKKF